MWGAQLSWSAFGEYVYDITLIVISNRNIWCVEIWNKQTSFYVIYMVHIYISCFTNTTIFYSVAVTTDGTPCVFPFTFGGVTYTSCTTASSNGVPWCSTTNDLARDGKFGNCALGITIMPINKCL